MNAATGVWQLRRIIIRYSETGGSSLHTRFYLRHLLPLWKERNPQVAVTTEHSLLEHPLLKAEWESGETYEVSLRKLRPRQVEDILNLQRNSHSPNHYLKHGGPRTWTERRSIQGLWQPSAELMFESLRMGRLKTWVTKCFQGLKYSETSLQLTRQHLLDAKGRWGDQKSHPKGFDRHILEGLFNEPLLAAPATAGAAGLPE
eukprot:TRINITY_DN56973_c0_g1_i1.p1 TRINITY_DN56973_c0_g1~~TRINITY_DN56973_c0_g1_i1.p1  ORF type:complete len:225 (-),score=27.43 TRINITY_DN56973_c0_g1_i1:101-706(-)